MGTLRDRIIPLTDEQKEGQTENRNWNAVYGEPLNDGFQAPVKRPVPQAAQNKSQTLYEMVSSYGKPYDYTQEIKDAERNRKIGIFTDLAGLAGNLISGRRKFGNVPLATDQANAHLRRLKDLQRQGEVNYQNTLRGLRTQQYMLDRQDAIWGEENARRDKQYQDQLNYRNNQSQRQRYRDALTDERYKEQRKDTKEAREFSQGMQRKSFDRALANDRDTKEYRNSMLAAKSSGASKNSTDYLIGANGKKSVFPKEMQGAVAGYLYNRMQNILANSPGDNRSIEDVKMQFGEGGDQTGKTLAIVRRRIKDFPELQGELEQILGNGAITSKTIDWGDDTKSTSNSKKIGW